MVELSDGSFCISYQVENRKKKNKHTNKGRRKKKKQTNIPTDPIQTINEGYQTLIKSHNET